MSFFSYQNGQLCVEQLPLTDLAERFGTPLYVYSAAALDGAYARYQTAFASLNPLLCYAVKANGNLSILRHFARLGAGFDIVSGGELARVLAAGGEADKVIFSGVGKTEPEIQSALRAGIRCFNVESVNELHRLNAVAGRLGVTAPISLRVNPDVDAGTHPYISTGLRDNKFGVAFEQAFDTYQQAAALPNLRITGIDCHIGSQLIDVAPLIDALDRLLLLVDRLAAVGIELAHIDIGGGVGIRYQNETPPDLHAYAQAVASRLKNRNLHLMLEPGRSLVGDAGVLLTRIEYLKQGDGKRFAIIDAAMNDLIRPALYSAYHDIQPVSVHAGLEAQCYDVVGPICESSDFLGKDRQLAVQEGDLLAVHAAGAYGATMASNYNARLRPAEVLVSGNEVRLISRRETLDEMLTNEKECL